MKRYEPMPGIELPNVAMGCMRIPEMSLKDLERLIMTAFEGGVTFYDHADIYGDGMSEVRFAEAVALHPGFREKIWVQTKCGIRKGFYDSSYEHIMQSVEDSLRRLKTDYLDSLLIHRPDALTEPQEVAKAFDQLAASGKVRHFGVSNHHPMQIEVLKGSVKQPLIFNQLQLSIMHTDMIDSGINVNTKFEGAINREGSVLEYSKLNHMVIQAWSPFQYGFFDGVFIDNPKFPELNETMDRIAAKYAITKTALAVAWLVRIPAMVQVVSGTTNLQRMKEIIAGANVHLDRSDWYEVYRLAGNKLP